MNGTLLPELDCNTCAAGPASSETGYKRSANLLQLCPYTCARVTMLVVGGPWLHRVQVQLRTIFNSIVV